MIPTQIEDVKLLAPDVYSDHRGTFSETFRKNWFEEHIQTTSFVQDNLVTSKGGVLRGLHYQLNHPQGKLISVVMGSIYDVVVDLRRSSPSFGQWLAVELTEQNRNQLWVPAGFAHGYLVVSELAIVHYKCTAYYDPHSEQSIRWNDSSIGIEWPLAAEQTPILSDKDRNALAFNEAPFFP